MKKLISIITLLSVLIMCVVPVVADDAMISVFYEDDLKVNFTMSLEEDTTYDLDGVNAISSNDPDTTISIIYKGENMATFAVSPTQIFTEYSTVDPDAMIISGNEKDALQGTPVTVSVFYSGKDYDNFIDGITGQIATVLIGETDANGDWAVEFVPAISGEYDIYAGTSYREVLMKTSYVMADRKSIIDTIKTADKETVKGIFADDLKLKGIVADLSVIGDVENTGRIGEILYGIREELENVDDVLKYLDLACLMSVMGAEKTFQTLENVLEELEDLDVVVNNLGIYEENKTDAIGNAVAKKLAKKLNNGISGFTSAFKEALILGGVEGCSTWADIAPFMELLNNSDYKNNVYDVSVAVVGNDYETIELLEKAVKSAVKTPGGSPGPGGSGGGGGSAGGGFGGSSGSSNTNTDNMFGIIPEKELEETNKDTKPEGKILFTDVEESHWAFDSIHYLYWQEVVSGDDKGKFNPDNNVTRAEIIKMLCNAFGVESVAKVSFEDVSPNDWFYGYAGAAYKAGLLQGYDGKMNPNDLLTREDMAVLVYRFAQYAGVEFDVSDVEFKDHNNISDYAKEAIAALNGAGYVNGMGDGNYSPKGNSTRAQVATIIYRFITRK